MPKQWFPLESNPSVMNAYAGQLGLALDQYSFCDVLSTEDWAIAMVPSPALALIMLFPISAASESHRNEESQAIASTGQIVSPNVYYMKQTVDNACGTVGILHALVNAQASGLLPAFPEGSYIDTLIKKTKQMTPDEKAAYLEADDEIEVVHESAASEGQSNQIDINSVNSHFVCFSVVDGYLYELDGRKQFPVNHGPSSHETLIADASRVVQAFMARDPEELRFTMIALAPTMSE